MSPDPRVKPLAAQLILYVFPHITDSVTASDTQDYSARLHFFTVRPFTLLRAEAITEGPLFLGQKALYQ